MRTVVCTIIAACTLFAARDTTRLRSQTLTAIDSIPPAIGNNFKDATAFVETSSGGYLVFDRRVQAVFAIDRGKTAATRITRLGEERGYIIRPTGFAYERGGTFVVADRPTGHERIQRFAEPGYLLNGFTLPAARAAAPLGASGYVGGGISYLQYNGDSIFINQPQTGSLVSELSWDGRNRRAFGALRVTSQDSNNGVRYAMNSGIPLIDPTGGFFFVFRAGTPVFRKYDAAGTLLFERHIEGRELDSILQNQPSEWRLEADEAGAHFPAVPAVVRAAAVDESGRLWVALETAPFVYVYSPEGDKVQTLQLRGTDPLLVTNLFFASRSRLLVTPGCHAFEVGSVQ